MDGAYLSLSKCITVAALLRPHLVASHLYPSNHTHITHSSHITSRPCVQFRALAHTQVLSNIKASPPLLIPLIHTDSRGVQGETPWRALIWSLLPLIHMSLAPPYRSHNVRFDHPILQNTHFWISMWASPNRVGEELYMDIGMTLPIRSIPGLSRCFLSALFDA